MANNSIRGRLLEMEVGEVVDFEMKDYRNLRTYAYEAKVIDGRLYHVNINRDKNVVSVTREE